MAAIYAAFLFYPGFLTFCVLTKLNVLFTFNFIEKLKQNPLLFSDQDSAYYVFTQGRTP